MFSRMTRRRRARHAAKTTPTPSRPVSQGSVFGPLPSGSMRQRPVVDFTDPSPLRFVPNDGMTVTLPAVATATATMRTVTLSVSSDATVVARAMADTATIPTIAADVPPSQWYSRHAALECEWPDVDDAPSQVVTDVSGSGEWALTRLEMNLAASRETIVASLGSSALTHRTEVGADWFRADVYEASLSSFWAEQDDERARARDRRVAAMNRNYKVTPVRARQDGQGLDTGIVPVVARPEFDRIGVSR